jgi:hypothetical protein
MPAFEGSGIVTYVLVLPRAKELGSKMVADYGGLTSGALASHRPNGSTPRSGRGGRRFKSCQSDHFFRSLIAYGERYGGRNIRKSFQGIDAAAM